MIISAAVVLALPALAQDRAPPAATATPLATTPVGASPVSSTSASEASPGFGESETGITAVSAPEVQSVTRPVELPDHARRDPWVVGRLDSVKLGLGANPWGMASGAFLSSLMRRTDTPIASRWAHIALRNALLAKVKAPRNVNPVDWTAERGWLLLRMGEADAARMLVSGVDVDKFTPKMFQVAVQSALANADPAGLCPLLDGVRKVEPRVFPLVDAMCASLSGEPESAAAQIDAARRRGRIGGIDLVLAQKVVGAGADTGRAVTVEWEPVQQLTSWRFGLATATGMAVPDRLLKSATPQVRAWQARAPLLSPQQRLDSARIATGLGVLSSQSLIDLYSMIYDATDPDQLSETEAWQVRLAFAGKDRDARIKAIRRLWSISKDPLQVEASRALSGRAATLIAPDASVQEDAPALIASMLAAGYDREAARWTNAVRRMDERFADPSWAMLVLSAPETAGLDLSFGRINAFISRDQSEGKKRSALLVAGLAGLGRIDARSADRLNRRHGLAIGHLNRWTRLIDGSAALGQAGSVLVLTATGFQSTGFERLPSSHLYHAVAALSRTGQGYTARMIAAEALART
ncbi:hypothetical protein [Sphingomonas sp.]|uniref:hypothetical protein n=1 Tax=Sphingomonas sp. TaxID=28214 RepID=UPI00286BF823|nr:hypothetical protein [Sphingomonas sp.]